MKFRPFFLPALWHVRNTVSLCNYYSLLPSTILVAIVYCNKIIKLSGQFLGNPFRRVVNVNCVFSYTHLLPSSHLQRSLLCIIFLTIAAQNKRATECIDKALYFWTSMDETLLFIERIHRTCIKIILSKILQVHYFRKIVRPSISWKLI